VIVEGEDLCVLVFSRLSVVVVGCHVAIDRSEVATLYHRAKSYRTRLYKSNWDLWWLLQKYHWRDCDKFGSMSKCQRELWVQQEVLPNQCKIQKQTLRDVWDDMFNHFEGYRGYLGLLGCTKAINFAQQQIWCMDYCSLSLLNHATCHLLQLCIFSLAKWWKPQKKVSDSTTTEATSKQ